jgi:hypothetical protein
MQKPAIPRSLYGFLNKYGPERSIIINRDLKTTVKVNNCDVMFITLWDLLFETSLDL